MEDEYCLKYNSHAVCPHCGYMDFDSYELEGDDGEGGIVECSSCGRQYRYVRHVSISYSTSVVDWLEEWRCYNHEQINRHSIYESLQLYSDAMEDIDNKRQSA